MALHPAVATLQTMKNANAFNPYIDYVRFPRFRNLEADTKIEFTFPITVFVGQNGSGKSSALQAMFGCPKGKSVGTYWFNTATDPIRELTPDDRHCLIYSYDGGGAQQEVLKTRINKVGQPDLWDTSEPIAKYRMAMGPRTSPVEKEVTYINFRAVPSAFERAFHEERPPATGIQDHLRYRSYYLQRAFASKRIGGHFRHKTHEAIVKLPPQELKAISQILARDYTEALLLKHRLFWHWGYSVLLQTAHASYSEAFAGSGETAVVILVHELLNAPEKSLLLLDEPETSIHPGAQRAILDLLLEQCKLRKHQIIISTHSPALVEGLPASSVKVFTTTADGKFRLVPNVLPQESFYFLGQPLPTKRRIIVEDKLAKQLVETALGTLGEQTSNLFEVVHYTGGASAMKQDATFYSRPNGPQTFLLFDGDQAPQSPIFDPTQLTTAVNDDPDLAIALLNGHIAAATNSQPIHFVSDGGRDGGSKVQQRDLRKQYLAFLRTNVFYLPMASPEQAIWDDAIVDSLLQPLLSETAFRQARHQLDNESNFKAKFVHLAQALAGDTSSTSLQVFHTMLIKAWTKNQEQEIQATRDVLNRIRTASS